MKVASGSPSRVPSMSPLIATDTARPRNCSSTSRMHSETARPKNAWAATPVTIRATTITAYEEARAASRFPARKIAKTIMSAGFGDIRSSAATSSGPPRAMAAAKTVTR